MNKGNLETLSATMDGEVSKDELRFVLRRIDRDVSLVSVWASYHMVGQSLRSQLSTVASANFAARVMDAVEKEQMGNSAQRRRDWLRLSMGGAIAASVAICALMISQPIALESTHHSSQTANVVPNNGLGTLPSGAAHSDNILAAVPPSLSAYPVYGLSQRASITLGEPTTKLPFQRYLQSTVGSMSNYRALNNHDGSYLLLIDTPQTKNTPLQVAPTSIAHP